MPLVDANGNLVPSMPEWHQDINPQSKMTWCGQWFEFLGIDPKHDVDVVFFKRVDYTKQNPRRKNAGTNGDKD